MTFIAPPGEQLERKDYVDSHIGSSDGAGLLITRGSLWDHYEAYTWAFSKGSFSITELILDEQGQIASVRIKFVAYSGSSDYPIVGDLRFRADVSQEPANHAPRVSAGRPRYITHNWSSDSLDSWYADLSGTVEDDLLPAGNPLVVSWTKISGPGPVDILGVPKSAVEFYKPRTYVLRCTASDGEYTVSDEVTFVVGFKPETYHGFVYSGQLVIGTFDLRILPKGRFTGVVRVANDRLSLRGEFNEGNLYDSWYKYESSGSTKRVTAELHRSLGRQKIEGKILGFALIATQTSESFLGVSHKASPYTGAYTWITDVPKEKEGPFGYSYGTAKVSRNGAARFVGRLSDGRAISYGGFVGLDGELSLYWIISGKERFAGPVQFSNTTDGLRFLSPIQWIRSSYSSSAAFPDGFGYVAKLIGARYTPSRPGTNLLTRTPEPVSVHVQSFAPSWPGARNYERTLQTNNSFGPPSGDFTLTANPRTGLFRGKLTDPQGKEYLFNGAILQSLRAGGGYFKAGDEVGAVSIKTE